MTTNPTDGQVPTLRRRRGWRLFAALLVVSSGTAAAIHYTSRPAEDNAQVAVNDLPTDVGFDQQLNAQVPLDIHLRDEAGAVARLGDLFDGKPVILTLVYYECPMLCNMTMDAQLRSLTELSLDAGADFIALTVSFDPRENHVLAAAAKRTAIARYDRNGADRGWRFLTGDDSEVRRLADAVGFRYNFDQGTGQYAHPAGLVVLTPDGVVSRYLYGVEFPPRNLRLALVEASGGKIGSPADQVLLLCYRYDPTTGKYGLAIMHLLRLGGFVTVFSVGTAIILMIRRERHKTRQTCNPDARNVLQCRRHFEGRDS